MGANANRWIPIGAEHSPMVSFWALLFQVLSVELADRTFFDAPRSEDRTGSVEPHDQEKANRLAREGYWMQSYTPSASEAGAYVVVVKEES